MTFSYKESYDLAILASYTTQNLLAFCMQVLSETVADALTFEDDDETTETRVFIRHIDRFFDCLNVRNTVEGIVKRKPYRLPYTSPRDERFKVNLQPIHSIGDKHANFYCAKLYYICSGSLTISWDIWMIGSEK